VPAVEKDGLPGLDEVLGRPGDPPFGVDVVLQSRVETRTALRRAVPAADEYRAAVGALDSPGFELFAGHRRTVEADRQFGGQGFEPIYRLTVADNVEDFCLTLNGEHG
jgi:hypothetical protein